MTDVRRARAEAPGQRLGFGDASCQAGQAAAHRGWEAHNLAPPTDRQIDARCTSYPNAGIGLAYGPDGLLGVDLDFVEPPVAAQVKDIVHEALGQSDCLRVARLPKRLLLYRSGSGVNVPRKAFGGYEIFSTTGQTVLYGTHPERGRLYYWPGQSPEDVSPSDLPVVDQAALNDMVGALAPLCSRVGRAQHPAGTASGSRGRVADWLRIFNTTDAKPVDLCRAAVEAAPEGDRYPATFSAIIALVRVGFTDAEIFQHVVEPYLARFDRRCLPDRHRAIMSGLRWAREQIGPDADAIAAVMDSEEMCARWRARWRISK